MEDDEANDVYEFISQKFKVSFKSQLKGSKLKISKIVHQKDLITGEESYQMKIDKSAYNFDNRESFCKMMIYVCQLKIKELEKEEYELNEEIQNSRFWDENYEFTQRERIGFLFGKYQSIIKRLETYINPIKKG